jgi:hypothetical protein
MNNIALIDIEVSEKTGQSRYAINITSTSTINYFNGVSQ